ncbi:hypothetical protein apy_03010 [Aeropyrum pernix]|uniref:Uncharacterized protein n=1 Tax=Aeropyrum pernix TaxID=56636 RepID=A0A401H7Y6_AERPX|nr:hypothetical protein [Aeropyrum pernix]GBF08576.1 hypothetical protein apy_03010 [Aeropyrum pernix]
MQDSRISIAPAAVAPVLLVFYAVLKSVSAAFSIPSGILGILPLLLAVTALSGLIVSISSPRDGLLSIIASGLLGYAFLTAGYISSIALAAVLIAHIAGLGIGLLKGGLIKLPSPTRTREIDTGEGGDELIDELEEFQPVHVRNEEDLEKQLYQYLKARGHMIERQPLVAPGLRPDLRVGDCIIELKVPRGRGDLQRLLGQVEDYLRYNRCLIVYILDTGMIPWAMLKTYKHRLREKGAKVIIKSVREH